jgi:asparagine synthase (glutamine-hydrolysing)
MASIGDGSFSGGFLPTVRLDQETGASHFTSEDGLQVSVWGKMLTLPSNTKDGAPALAERVASLFRKKGWEGLGVLDGSYTCLIRTQEASYLVRDHHGTGPQVYYTHATFASSLMSLVEQPGFTAKPDFSALSDFLTRGYISVPRSAFQTVEKLGAGHVLCVKDGQQYVHLLPKPIVSYEGMSEEDMLDAYGRLHRESILRRLDGHNHVGILLSGGYDSGSNLAALRAVYNGDIHSFSIGFKGDTWSELPLAKILSETYGTVHHTYEIDGHEVEALPDIIRQLGDPFVEGGLMVNYAVMKLAAEHPQDVLLGGDGNDQLFGTTGREIALSLLIKRCGLRPALKLTNRLLAGSLFDRNGYPYKVKFHTDKILHVLEGDSFGFPPERLTELVHNPTWVKGWSNNRQDTSSFEAAFLQHARMADSDKTINQVILFKASKLADYFGHNLAFPYMDLDMQALIDAMPVSLRWKGEGLLAMARGRNVSKYALKRVYKPLLPEAITNRKKQGGFAPMPLFFADPSFRQTVRSTILDSKVCGDFLNRAAVERFLNRYDREAAIHQGWFWYRQNRAIQLFNLYTLALWWRQYVERG